MIDTVIVAALVCVNETLVVIEPVTSDATKDRSGRHHCMLHFQKLDVYQRSVGMDVLERIVAMLTKLIAP